MADSILISLTFGDFYACRSIFLFPCIIIASFFPKKVHVEGDLSRHTPSEAAEQVDFPLCDISSLWYINLKIEY